MKMDTDQLREWFKEGKAKGATHLICAYMTTGEYQHFPVYVMPGENPEAKADEVGSTDGRCGFPPDEIVAIFSLTQPFDDQWAKAQKEQVHNFK